MNEIINLKTICTFFSLCNSVTFLVDEGFNAKEAKTYEFKVFVKELFESANLPRKFYPSKGYIKSLFTDVDKSYYIVWWIKKIIKQEADGPHHSP